MATRIIKLVLVAYKHFLNYLLFFKVDYLYQMFEMALVVLFRILNRWIRAWCIWIIRRFHSKECLVKNFVGSGGDRFSISLSRVIDCPLLGAYGPNLDEYSFYKYSNFNIIISNYSYSLINLNKNINIIMISLIIITITIIILLHYYFHYKCYYYGEYIKDYYFNYNYYRIRIYNYPFFSFGRRN